MKNLEARLAELEQCHNKMRTIIVEPATAEHGEVFFVNGRRSSVPPVICDADFVFFESFVDDEK